GRRIRSGARVALPGRRLRLRREAEYPAPSRRARLPGDGAARAGERRRGARYEARRGVPLERPGRPGALRLRDRGDPRDHRRRRPDVRHLPRPPADGARVGREDREDEVRAPRRQPPGEGPRDRHDGRHQPEPRLRRRPGDAAAQPQGDPRVAVRRQPAGAQAHRPPRVLLPGPPRGEPGTARHRLPVRPLRKNDGGAQACVVNGAALVPKRTDIRSVLIIGAGPIVIGQACEFDYSGAQACKALREEGYKVILVNSNPATIMTDPEMADVTYIEPVTWQMLE